MPWLITWSLLGARNKQNIIKGVEFKVENVIKEGS